MAKKVQNKPRTRGFCFTVPNYTDDDISYLMAMYHDDTNVKYLVVGFEISPRTHTPHIQGYVYFTNPKRISEVFYKGCGYHIEPQRSKSDEKAFMYCMKESDYIEYGTRPSQGHRVDLDLIRYDIDKYHSKKFIMDNHFSNWTVYRRSFDVYFSQSKHYDTKLIVFDHKDPTYCYPIIYDYTQYPKDCTKIITNVFYPHKLLATYYKGTYQYVIVSDEHIKDFWLEKFIQEKTYLYIANATTNKREEQILKEVYKETTDSDSSESDIEFQSDQTNSE